MMIITLDDKWLLHITNTTKDHTQEYIVHLDKPLSGGDLSIIEQMVDNAIKEIGGVTKQDFKEYMEKITK